MEPKVLLKETVQYKVDDAATAERVIEAAKEGQREFHYTLTKASYEYKTKKARGEIIADCYVVTLVKSFGGVWDDVE